MKRILFIVCTIILPFIGVNAKEDVKLVGNLNMVSTRNVNTDFKYEVLKTYAGGSKSEIKEAKKMKIDNIDDAVNISIKKVPGGEFMMNVKIWVISDSYYYVEGDVWGRASTGYRGFNVGDKVTYQSSFGTKYITATIKGFKDASIVIVTKENGKSEEKDIDELVKAE